MTLTTSSTPKAITQNPFLRYLILGWSVIPLQHQGKLPESRLLPSIPDEHDPTRSKRSWKPYQSEHPTEEVLADWWRAAPLNVGIVTGRISGIVVLDLDNNTAIRSAYERGLPVTPMAATGKGLHIYFRAPEETIGNRANFDTIEGFDFRGEGGYVVAPPSVHPDGHTYRWTQSPEDAPLAEMPTWLQQLLATSSHAQTTAPATDSDMTEQPTTTPLSESDRLQQIATEMIDAELEQVRRTRQGGRNDQLNRSSFALGQLVGAGLAHEGDLEARLESAALAIGLPRHEARGTIRSGMSAGKRNPRIPIDLVEPAEGKTVYVTSPGGTQRESHTAALIRIGKQATLFRSTEKDLYARYQVGNRYETHLIGHPKSPFRLWVGRQFYQEFGIPPSHHSLQQALEHLEQHAYYAGDTRKVFTRVGSVDDTIYLALNDSDGTVVEIDRNGWRLVQEVPVIFRTTRNGESLPRPIAGGSVEALRPLLNLPDEAAWVLCVGWLIGALHPKGPYSHLAVFGEQGSGKSSLLRALRACIDPAKAEENGDPRTMDDFMVTAINNHILSYDNLSGVPEWWSNSLCRLSSGAGLIKRSLYSNYDEVVLEAARPVLLNGIIPVVTRPDLVERTIVLELPRITPDRRLAERHFERELARVTPTVLGALLDAVVVALQRIDVVQFPQLPRLADFALWVEAAAPALGWESGTFLRVYLENEASKEEAILEADDVAETLLVWADYKVQADGTPFAITMKQLLAELDALRLAHHDPKAVGTLSRMAKLPAGWPEYPRGLLARLTEARPLLRKWGVEYEKSTRNKQGQVYQFRRIGGSPVAEET